VHEIDDLIVEQREIQLYGRGVYSAPDNG